MVLCLPRRQRNLPNMQSCRLFISHPMFFELDVESEVDGDNLAEATSKIKNFLARDIGKCFTNNLHRPAWIQSAHPMS